MSKLSNPSEIKRILESHGFHFSKALGQNFLIDSSVCPKMAQMCGADETTPVLEVGPGIGVLTHELSQVAENVVAVELDKRLLPVLDETLADCKNVEIVNGDIMDIDIKSLTDERFGEKEFCVCANLPYYITSPVIMTLIESKLPIKSVTVMVQREAAKRMCAKPGERECGAVSVSVHYHSEPEILFNVSRNSFMPAPNVDSAVIRLDMRKAPPVEVADEEFFFKVARSAFSQRRKTAANSISAMLKVPKPMVEEALEAAELEKNIRAERITLDGFARLSNSLKALAETS